MPKDETYYHNKGEKDAAEGKDKELPHGANHRLFNVTGKDLDAENRAYEKGYHYAQGQKDASEGKTPNQPHGATDYFFGIESRKKMDEDNEAYKSGHDNGIDNSEKKGCFIATATLYSIGKKNISREL